MNVMKYSERVSRVLLMLADEQREVPIMEQGNIAVAVGMKNVSCGLGYAHTHMHVPYFLEMSLRRDLISRRSTMQRQFEGSFYRDRHTHSFNNEVICTVDFACV